MLRITRFISKKRIADLIQLPNVLKIDKIEQKAILV